MASLRLGSLFGIPIRLGISFLLILPLLAYLIGSQVGLTVDLINGIFGTPLDPEPLTAGLLPWLLGVGAALGLFASVLLHELGHSLVARRYGLETESITLWFLGGLAQFAELPDDWRQEFAIAIAGPVVSVALGILFYGSFELLAGRFPAVRFVIGYLAVLNVVLAAFNMLPGFPMDGGRVLRAVLSRNRSRLQATRIAAAVGKGFAFLLGITGVFTFNLFWIFIAFFIYIAATSETRQVVMQAAFERLTVREIMTPAAELDTVAPETSIDTLLDRMVRERHTGYPVVDGNDLVGIVTLEDVQERASDRRDDAIVNDIMSTDLVTVRPGGEATNALTTLQQEDIGRLLVTEGDGSLAGLISRTDLMTVLEITQISQSTAATPPTIER
ncbi:Zn-dependent protease (includes SpoIVFB) [Haladaptatus litoreus]|uniref:Zinc metalloprotease n=1 Tax=Haladaptatus litoreus TaxID=553468 RepID=A0A1N7CUH1_9EURY|nr:site-2 protease family protein [Haladaptatus litoreus]SIR67298.1 Zn-dependent protease (includes SpoIVFB) [Haladaptatus litoreus]